MTKSSITSCGFPFIKGKGKRRILDKLAKSDRTFFKNHQFKVGDKIKMHDGVFKVIEMIPKYFIFRKVQCLYHIDVVMSDGRMRPMIPHIFGFRSEKNKDGIFECFDMPGRLLHVSFRSEK
jgi:hypothetical protein